MMIDMWAEQPETEQQLLVACRDNELADGPYVPSVERCCAACGEKVLVSCMAMRTADKMRILCVPCAVKMLNPDETERKHT